MKKFLTILLGGVAFVAASAYMMAQAPAQAPGVNSPYNPVWSIPIDNIKKTYGATIYNISPLATTTTTADDLATICGSSTKTIKVTKIRVGGRAAAVQPMDIVLLKRSTVGTMSTAAGAIPFSASDSAATASLHQYWFYQTVGAYLGVIAVAQQYLGNLTTGLGYPDAVFDFGQRAKAPTLNSATQCLAVSLSGQSVVSGNRYNVAIEWTEEP